VRYSGEVVNLPCEDRGLGSGRHLAGFERFHLCKMLQDAAKAKDTGFHDTNHNKSHFSYAAYQTICRRSASVAPPITDIWREFFPRDTNGSPGGDPETFVGDEHA